MASGDHNSVKAFKATELYTINGNELSGVNDISIKPPKGRGS